MEEASPPTIFMIYSNFILKLSDNTTEVRLMCQASMGKLHTVLHLGFSHFDNTSTQDNYCFYKVRGRYVQGFLCTHNSVKTLSLFLCFY